MLFGALYFLSSCNNNDDYNACFTPPELVIFEWVDENGNNLIENGVLNVSQINIKETLNGQVVRTIGFNIVQNKMVLKEIGFFDGDKNYALNSPYIDFDFQVKSVEITGSCGGYKIDEITFDGISPETDGYFTYKIVINTP